MEREKRVNRVDGKELKQSHSNSVILDKVNMRRNAKWSFSVARCAQTWLYTVYM